MNFQLFSGLQVADIERAVAFLRADNGVYKPAVVADGNIAETFPVVVNRMIELFFLRKVTLNNLKS